MTNHANHKARLSWALGPILFVMLTPPSVAASPPPASTDKALRVQLEQNDFDEFIQGIKQPFLNRTIKGRVDRAIQKDFWFAAVGVAGIDFELQLKDLDIELEDGSVDVAAHVGDLAINIEKLYFNDSRSLYCADIPVSSGRYLIPSYFDVVPHAQNREFAVSVRHPNLVLGDNFRVGNPDECHVIWGVDWVLKKTVPWVAELAKGYIEESLENAVAKTVEKVADSYSNMMTAGVTLPFEIEPAPAFYATLKLWPRDIELTRDELGFNIGADIRFDPDPRTRELGESTLAFGPPDLPSPSYLGLGVGLVDAVLREANKKGLVDMSLDADSMPGLAEFFHAENVAMVIPDAKERFGAKTPFSLEVSQAAGTEATLHREGPERLPEVTTQFREMPMTIRVDGKPYYHLVTTLSFDFRFGYAAGTRQLQFGLTGLRAKAVDGWFAEGLEPKPENKKFRRDVFQALVGVLEDRALERAGNLMAFEIPPIQLGDRWLRLTGSSIREDEFIALGLSVNRK